MLSKYYSGFNNKKSYFRASLLGFVDNFEQHFESCALNTQNIFKRTLNKVNGLIRIKLSKFSVLSAFSNMLYGKKRKPGNAGNQQKAFYIRKHSLLAVTIIRKLLKSYQFGIYVSFWLQEQGKLLLSFITALTLIISITTLRVVPQIHRTLRKVL